MTTEREVTFTLTHKDTTTTLRFLHVLTGMEVTVSFPDELPVELEPAASAFLENIPGIMDSAAKEIEAYAHR